MFSKRCFAAVLSWLPLSSALTEDEAYQYEWFLQQLGEPTELAYSAETADRVFVASASGAIGSLSLKDGSLQWRRAVPEQGGMNVLRLAQAGGKGTLLSVSGKGLVQAWKDSTGDLTWQREHAEKVIDLFTIGAKQRSMAILHPSELEVRSMAGKHEWSVPAGEKPGVSFSAAALSKDESQICALASGSDSGTVIVTVDANTGSVVSKKEASPQVTNAMATGSFTAAGGYVAFLSGDKVITQQLCDGAVDSEFTLKVKTEGKEPFRLMPWRQTPGVFAVTNGATTAILGVGPKGVKLLRTFDGVAAVGPVYTSHDDEEGGQPVAVAIMTQESAQIQLMDPASGNVQPAIHVKGYNAADHGDVRLVLLRELSSGEHTTIISAADHSIAVLQGHQVSWVREESLASVRSATFYGRIADQSASFETEKKVTESPLDAIMAQVNTLPSLFAELADKPVEMLATLEAMLGGQPPPPKKVTASSHTTQPRSSEELRSFGGDKLVIAATRAGKVLALEATTGAILWTKYFKADLPATCSGIALHNGVCGLWMSLVPTSSATYNELLIATPPPAQEFIWLDPHTGSLLHREKAVGGISAASIIPLPAVADVTVMPFAYVDVEHGVHFMPSGKPAYSNHAAQNAGRLFHYEVDRVAQEVKGFALGDGTKPMQNIWNMELASVGEEIIAAASPVHREWDHVPVHIKGDASILYKYVNPNMIALATQDSSGKDKQPSLNLYMLDAVTGKVLHQSRVRGASGPISLVVCDNWVVMHYWNAAKTRFEINVVELFEDRKDDGPWNILFGGKMGNKSRSAHHLDSPVPLQQTYIFPAGVTTFGVTATLKGITPRSLIMALTTDHVFRVSKDMLNPRRPIPSATGSGFEKGTIPAQFAPTKEEAVPPYQAILPLRPYDVLTHNNPVTKIEGIISSPTALESTSLVFCYGLDLFFTPVQTAKAYDVLSPSFNYKFLYLSVGAVVILVLVTSYIAQYKALQERWK